MSVWVINFIYLGFRDGVIIGCSNWNSISVLKTFDNASKLRAFTVSWNRHFHIQVRIVKYIMCVLPIISLRYFIIFVDAFNIFAKNSIVINKVCPMVGVVFIPNVSILNVDFYALLHGLIELLKHIL